MQLAKEQEYALQCMLSGENVFLTGEAGTGKSTIIKEFKRKTSKNCVLLAPTGIAAVNIGGSTIHSFFQIAPGVLTKETIEPLINKKQRELIRNVDVIIIDEISMVRSDLFWAVDYRLRQVVDKKKAFGGKQIILVGDFYQLPPVVKSEDEEQSIISIHGGVFAFQTKTWSEGTFKSIYLKTVHRQGNDALFLLILNHIRHNDLYTVDISVPGSDIMLNVREALNRYTDIRSPLDVSPVCLCTTNREANIINAIESEKISEKGRVFKAVIKGKFPEKDYPTPNVLELKKGSRVMTLINRRTSSGVLEFVNGDMGEIIQFIGKNGQEMIDIKLDNGKRVSLSPNEWKNYEYILTTDPKTGKDKVEQKETGSFIQFPLKLAYAMTIHKSQGLSVDAVLIKLGNGCFAHGQLYTALSRCRSLRNLRIDRQVWAEDIIVNQSVVDFYSKIEAQSVNKSTVSIEIPAEYQDAVNELLIKLMNQDIASMQADAETKKDRVLQHPDIDKLIVVYNNQTSVEKNNASTKKMNGQGFNKFDAPILTPIAEKYLLEGSISRNELLTVSRLIPKYHRQWEE